MLLGIAARWMVFALLILLLIFSSALGTAWWHHLPLACHCFGEVNSREVSFFHRSVLRNAGLGSVALGIGLASASARRSPFPALLIDRAYQPGLLGAWMALALLLVVLALWAVFAAFRRYEALR
ncbi:MauE/DoxX family redox-associated membrane protein [Thermogemmatispora sp.]|uniref:MauE/DoxX family redox-associated membrane protein n=1 Tax=Thermogemmatispora sp. TaxID=1968838 RepID=UPI003452B7C1